MGSGGIGPGEQSDVGQDAIRALSQAANHSDGAIPLSDAVLLSPGRDSVHLAVWSDSEELDGYAYVDPVSEIAELVVRPEARGHGIGTELVSAAITAGARRFWAHGDQPAARALARRFGARPERTLYLLARTEAATPAPPSPPAAQAALPAGYRLRRYAGEADDEGLLRVNSAAFTDLPDQGSWSKQDVRARVEADWFDPDGLLVLERTDNDASVPGAQIVGFHWTKVHPDGTGEVYVLALDPSVQGHRLAGPLTCAGLAQLRRRGCSEVVLFVDSGNVRALRLYERLGFTRRRSDVLYAVGAETPGGWTEGA